MLQLIIITILGLVLGSFVGALSWRLPRGRKITEGRSVCDNCNKEIPWYDNIPVISYILLKGQCRHCNKKVSIRYPLIELGTGLVFLTITFFYLSCTNIFIIDSPVCFWRQTLGWYSLPFLLTLSTMMLFIFIVDLENQIIPDNIVHLLLIVIFGVVLTTDIYIWEQMFAGFLASIFLLGLHLITFGKGMGLGDVKLALPIGIFLGFKLMVAWMFLSFLIGAVIGVMLIALNKAKLGKHIAFGPFLVLSFFMILLFGGLIENFVFLN